MPYDQPLGRTREIVAICRSVWRREVLTHQGIYTLPLPKEQGMGLGKPLKLVNQPVRDRIPVWLAALGDKNVELAAEIAEGWLPFLFYPEKRDLVWGAALRAGMAKRAPELGQLQITAGGFLAVEEDYFDAADSAARLLSALYIGGMGAPGKNFYNTVFTRFGYPQAAAKIQQLYLNGRKDEAAAALPDEFIRHTNLIGPPEFVKDRIAVLREAGVTHLNVTPIGSDPNRLLTKAKEWIS